MGRAAHAAALCAAFALGLFFTPASALSRVQVSPIAISLADDGAVEALRVKNLSVGPVAFQAAAMAWTQQRGEDVLAATEDVVLAPPAFVIQPGGEQILRIASAGGARDVERAYRLFLTETPIVPPEGGIGARMRLEFSVPVFVAPLHPQAGAPVVTLAEGAGAEPVLRVANPTNTHIKIDAATIENMRPEGARERGLREASPALPLPRYLLAGSSVDRPLSAAGVSLHLAYEKAGAQESEEKDFSVARASALRGAQP